MIDNPWFIGIAGGLVIVSLLMGTAAFSIWFERKFAEIGRAHV